MSKKTCEIWVTFTANEKIIIKKVLRAEEKELKLHVSTFTN